MMKAHFAISRKKRTAALALCLFVAALLLPAAARADGADKYVRVGWYDSSYNTVDDTGRRSGYAYDYQQKLAAYTGWKYEYVTGSWSELLQMLIDGEIDLMSDVSWTEERAKLMLYPELPMGAEEYFLFKVPGNREIRSADPSTLNGKRIGVNKDSVQADFFRDWAQRNDVRAELVELSVTEDESLRMMETDTLDALLEEHGLSCNDLKLEVTESACTENPNQVITVIERLRKKGYAIEMDDFGTGYSSLNMLSSLPINVLKLDRADAMPESRYKVSFQLPLQSSIIFSLWIVLFRQTSVCLPVMPFLTLFPFNLCHYLNDIASSPPDFSPFCLFAPGFLPISLAVFRA